MLWWDDLLKNIQSLMDNNLSTQEGQVEGQVVNDQQVNTQKGGLGSTQSKLKDTLTVSGGVVEFRGFRYEVGTDYSTYISGKYRQGVIDGELDKINSQEDLEAFLDKLIEEKKEKDKNKPSKRSKKTKEELEENLTIALNALMELEPDKSPKDLIKRDQALWEKQRLEKLDQVEKDLTEALDRTKAERQALKANQEQAL